MFNNSGDQVRLICQDQVIDSTSYTAAPKGSYWAKDKNDSWCWTNNQPALDFLCPQPTPTPTLTPTPIPTPFIHPEAGCFNLIITKLYPAPNRFENEMIKLYNPHPFAIDLAPYFLDDKPGQADPISLLGSINPLKEKQIVLDKAIFNNSGDQARLICAGKIIDAFGYQKSFKGQIVIKDKNQKLCWLAFNFWQVPWPDISCPPKPTGQVPIISLKTKKTSSFKSKSPFNKTYSFAGLSQPLVNQTKTNLNKPNHPPQPNPNRPQINYFIPQLVGLTLFLIFTKKRSQRS